VNCLYFTGKKRNLFIVASDAIARSPNADLGCIPDLGHPFRWALFRQLLCLTLIL